MTLAEKIAALRGERKLSQGEVAERLDVSRQSVSKWETGQAVPELDKIVKLADLFGVSVDQLVRDGEVPAPEAAPAAEPEAKIIYVERRFTNVQTLGLILIAGGLVMMLFALAAEEFLFMGAFIAIAGLPLLLAKKHPFLVLGWVVWVMAYLLLCTPFFTGANWEPFTGTVGWWRVMNLDGRKSISIWLLWLAYLGESILTVALPICTVWLAWKKRNGRGEKTSE